MVEQSTPIPTFEGSNLAADCPGMKKAMLVER